MSVIFETLQKLKQGGDETLEVKPESRRQRRSLSMGRALFFPVGIILFIVVGLLIFFFWDFHGVDQIEDQLPRQKVVAAQDVSGIQAKQKTPETSSTDSPPAKHDVSLPPPPEPKAVQAKKGELYLPPSVLKEGREKEIARYIPPAEVHMRSVPLGEKKEAVQYVTAPGKKGSAGKGAAEADQTSEAGQRVQFKEANPNPFETPLRLEKVQDASRGKARSDKPEQQKVESLGEKSGKEMRSAAVPLERKKSMKQAPPSRRDQQATGAVRTVDRSTQMSRLVARFQQAVLGGDEKEAETLLETLESIKGKSDFVLRLKAFWHLKRGRYEQARSLLQRLINKNENDLEAGINMAVLDIKTNHLEEAGKRLRALRRLHEDNTLIPALLEKISR